MKYERVPSPIDQMPVPEHLTARVVEPGAAPRLHGYDVQDDLARHYGLGEVVLLALTGELPDRAAGRAIDVLLVFAAPITIAEAPSHAAALARLCSAKPSSVAAVAAIGLAEQARFRLEALAPLLAWLASGRDGPPPEETEDAATARLHETLRSVGAAVSARDAALPVGAAIVAGLFELGLREPWQIEAALNCARWPIAIAEAMSNTPGALGTYPIRLPEFELVRRVE
ncbi:MAG: hypothetical protein KF729_16970 [Sandaracinaceae bacterium]|nr:hypothetical protein [Sandaracinaceae bacterium]